MLENYTFNGRCENVKSQNVIIIEQNLITEWLPVSCMIHLW
jgi:hypothetical protein